MKIGIDARAAKWYRGTGIGTYTYQLLNSINKLEDKNEYLLFIPEKSNLEIKFNQNILLRNISNESDGSFWNEVNIPNILKDNEVDLYHVPQNGIGLPKYKNCPFIITLHDIIPYKMPETVGKVYLKLFLEQMPNIISLCDGIITVSNFSKRDIIDKFNYPEDKIFVTPLAAENIYKPYTKEISKEIIKQKYQINGDFILYVGGFSPRKNILGLIEAFSKLISRKKYQINLIIAGKFGKSYADYKQRTIDLNIEDKVIFPGYISMEHVPFLYCASTAFVYPSFYEGFGLPPVEAMACGVPVIASKVTSIPEILKDAALYTDPYDIDNMSLCLEQILEDNSLRNNLISKGLLRASELSFEATAEKTIEAYYKVLGCF